MAPSPSNIVLRYEIAPADRDAVREIVASTGFFSPAEVDIAVELVDERLAKGPTSGYEFVMADRDGQTVGYTCYGHIAGTQSSYDLYWIAVHRAEQGSGLGRFLMDVTERQIAQLGGRRVYAETSNRAQYAPTRAFYDRCGYFREAVIVDFYAPGDDKVIFVKDVGAKPAG
jgi:D-alanine-D-alanine ligase